jgi:cold shock protein
LSAGEVEAVIGNARVRWFSLDKKYGFVSLGGTAADAFLHLSVLKRAGYVAVPAGTSMKVRVETDRGRLRVVEVSHESMQTCGG